MKKLLLSLIFVLSSIFLMSQTPMDIFSKHRPYKVDGAFLGTAEFEYALLSRSMIQDCSQEYLMQLGIDTTYLNDFSIVQYIAIFHSNCIKFEDELDLSCYTEVDRYSKSGKSAVVYRQVRLNKFEEIIALSSNTSPVWYSLIYVQGIISSDMLYER
jgi:hypothetical protein